jgi:nucleosome binding factor SPN SPT16 subunit
MCTDISFIEQEARAKERNEHQRMLYQKKQTEALALLARGELGAGLNDSTQLRPAKNINAYETPARYPLEARPYQVYVDHESESVLFPIHGRLVPFHIDTIRSVSMPMEEPPFFYYHFYFDSPQKILGKNADIDSIAPADSMFIQDIGYRARDPRNLNRVVTEIKELKKKVQVCRFFISIVCLIRNLLFVR